MDLAARTQYLKEIKDFTNCCQSNFESLIASIGWTFDSLNRNATDSSGSNEAVTHDSILKPETQEGNQQLEDFEKRYNDLLSGLPTHQKKGQEKSEAEALTELLEFERNAKRRRISYKNKVHTKNKSHTEVLRELVREQMEVLKEISGEEKKEESVTEKQVENEEDSVGLIQLGFTKGNPHTVWQKIGQMVENRSADRILPSTAGDGNRDIRSRHYSREQPSKTYDKGDRGSWRCHDDRDDPYTNDRRRDKFDRNHSKNRDEDRKNRSKKDRRSREHRDDYDRHRHKSDRKRSRSPDR